MNTILQELIFDKEVVEQIKSARVNDGLLYNLLFSGKITMQEYLEATA